MSKSIFSNNNTLGISSLLLAVVSKFTDKFLEGAEKNFFEKLIPTSNEFLTKYANYIIPGAGIAITLLEHVAGHFLSDHLKRFTFSEKDPDKINHDIQTLLEHAVVTALENTSYVLSDKYYQKRQDKILNRYDEDASDTIILLRKISNRKALKSINDTLAEDFKKHPSLTFELPSFVSKPNQEKWKNDSKGLQTQAQMYFLEKISAITSNSKHSDLELYSNYLADQMTICFAEGLKQDKYKHAWVAYQKVTLENIQTGLTTLLDSQSRIEESINKLGSNPTQIVSVDLNETQKQELHNFMSALNDPSKFEVAFKTALDNTLDSLTSQIGRIETFVEGTHTAVHQIQGDINEIKSSTFRFQKLVYGILILAVISVTGIFIFKTFRKEHYVSEKTPIDTSSTTNKISQPEKAAVLNNQSKSKITNNKNDTKDNHVLSDKEADKEKYLPPACDIDGKTFQDDYSKTNKLTFIRLRNNTYNFNGMLEFIPVSGKLEMNGKNLIVNNNGVEGAMRLNDDCNKIIGSLKTKENDANFNINYNLVP